MISKTYHLIKYCIEKKALSANYRNITSKNMYVCTYVFWVYWVSQYKSWLRISGLRKRRLFRWEVSAGATWAREFRYFTTRPWQQNSLSREKLACRREAPFAIRVPWSFPQVPIFQLFRFRPQRARTGPDNWKRHSLRRLISEHASSMRLNERWPVEDQRRPHISQLPDFSISPQGARGPRRIFAILRFLKCAVQ